jgi:hypothetical protein
MPAVEKPFQTRSKKIFGTDQDSLKHHAADGDSFGCNFRRLGFGKRSRFGRSGRIWELDVGGSNPSTSTKHFK